MGVGIFLWARYPCSFSSNVGVVALTLASIGVGAYRGTSLMRKRTPLGPYSRTMPRALWGYEGVGRFLMSEVLL